MRSTQDPIRGLQRYIEEWGLASEKELKVRDLAVPLITRIFEVIDVRTYLRCLIKKPKRQSTRLSRKPSSLPYLSLRIFGLTSIIRERSLRLCGVERGKRYVFCVYPLILNDG
jgi:hypothetical protein